MKETVARKVRVGLYLPWSPRQQYPLFNVWCIQDL